MIGTTAADSTASVCALYVSKRESERGNFKGQSGEFAQVSK